MRYPRFQPSLQSLANCSPPSSQRSRLASSVFLAFLISAHPGTDLSAEEKALDPLAILQRECLQCHTEEKRKGGLLLTDRDALLAGGDSGPVASPGHSGGNVLIDVLFPDADSHMPPKGQLSPAEIVALQDWIAEGLPWNEEHWKRLQLARFEAPVELTALPSSYRPIFGLALSPDGKSLAVGRGNRIEWFSVGEKSGEEKKDVSLFQPVNAPTEPGPDTIQSLAWAPDGSAVAVGSFRRLTLWNSSSREKSGELNSGLLGRLSALSFTPDSKVLLVADSVDATAGRLHFIDPGTVAITRTVGAHDDTIFSIAISPDGKLAATTSADKSVKVWDIATGTLKNQLEGHTDYVLAAAFSPETDRLATAGDDEEIKIWRLETGKKVASFGGTRTGSVTALAWSTDEAKAKQKTEEKDKEKAAAINADLIVALNESGQPRIYTDLNEHEGEQRSTGAKEKSADASSIGLTALAFDPVSRRFFGGSTGGILTAWDSNGKLVAKDEPSNQIAQSNP